MINNESIFGDTYEKQKRLMVEARKLVEEYIFSRPSIDKFLREKVDDMIIIRELPLPIIIGEKKIFVGTFSIDTQYEFQQDYVKLLAYIAGSYSGLELGIKFFDPKNGADLYRILGSDKKAKKAILSLIEKTVLKKQNFIDPVTGRFYKLEKVSLKYFTKNVSIDQLIQICFLIYIYNFDATRRSLALIMGEMGVQQSGETYTWSWLQNLAGLSGKFSLNQLTSLGLTQFVVPNNPPPRQAPGNKEV